MTTNRFWNKVQKTKGCWNWTRYLHFGYGFFKYKNKTFRAHRFAWMITKGLIPRGKYILHKCDNRKCVRPSHLFLGTHQDNMDDMIAKKRDRHLKHEQHGRAKLNLQKVKQILNLSKQGFSQRYLSKKFSISKANIYYIQRRLIWV